MAISRFDEGALGAALEIYYNATEMPPVVTAGTDVDYVDPAYAGKGPRLTQFDPTDRITYNPAITIGALNSWQAYAGGASGLVGDLDITTDSYTIVVVQKANSAYTSNRWAYSLLNSANVHQMGYRSYFGDNGSGESYTQHANILGSTASILKPIRYNLDEPIVYIASRNANSDVYSYIKDTSDGPQTHYRTAATTGQTFSQIQIAKNNTYNGGLGGEQGIFALYNRALTEGEILDVQNLCQHWIDFGSAPVIERDTFTHFGAVLPNDSSPQCVLQWQWGNDVGTWFDVGDATNGLNSVGVSYSLATEAINGASHANNKLLIDSANTPLSIFIRCKATTPYNTDGIVTPQEGGTILTVEASS